MPHRVVPTNQALVLELRDGVAFGGTVLDRFGNRAADATVRVGFEGYWVRTTTDTGGRFQVSVPADVSVEYIAFLQRDGFQVARRKNIRDLHTEHDIRLKD